MKWLILFLITFFNSYSLFSQKTKVDDIANFSLQPDTLFVSKNKCSCDYIGYWLNIHESKICIPKKKCRDYTYEFLYTATDSQKINLVEQLLQFEDDTSLICSKVSCYSIKSLKYKDSIHSKRYNIQISALYHINLICFAQYASFTYSPYPVLYDTLLNQEINDDVSKLMEVFEIYKMWFKETKENNFKNYTFPLLDARYKWKYGDYSKSIVFKRLPVIKSEYKYKIGRPAIP